MPVTRSELLYFSAGMAAGALAHANFPKLKEALGPIVAGAMRGAEGTAFGDRCADIVRVAAEKFEAVQDAMAEMRQAAAAGANAAAEDATVAAASAAGVASPSATRNGKFEAASSPA